MFGGLFQPTHLLVILIIALLVFGPGKIPEIGSSLGKAIRWFKSAMNGPGEESGDSTDTKRVENRKE
jgi:sec-independent protein translocase protein TatA